MPLKLCEPGTRGTPYYTVRGTYLGVYVERSCRTTEKKIALRYLAKIKADIESGQLAPKGALTFAGAAMAYLDAGGESRFLAPLNDYFGDTPVSVIDQAALDTAAAAIYPSGTAATRNRQVYTPFIAIMTHNHVNQAYHRPKGAQGEQRTQYLEPVEAFRLLDAAAGIDKEASIVLTLALYTGMRLGEILGMKCRDVALGEGRAFVGKTKNGDPRAVHLPPVAVEALKAHPKGLEGRERVFRWQSTRKTLYAKARQAYARAKVDYHGEPFHILRHSFASWMRRYADADSRDLLDTGAWRGAASVDRYTHTIITDAAKLADNLPTRGKIGENG